MPKYKFPDSKGDLYIIYGIEMPQDDWLQSVDIPVRKFLFYTGSSFNNKDF